MELSFTVIQQFSQIFCELITGTDVLKLTLLKEETPFLATIIFFYPYKYIEKSLCIYSERNSFNITLFSTAKNYKLSVLHFICNQY